MRMNRAVHPIRIMARVLGVSASGFYAWRDRGPSERHRSDAVLLRRIRTIHAISHGTYGAPRVQAELRAEGTHVGRKRIARLMQGAGIAGVSRRRVRAGLGPMAARLSPLPRPSGCRNEPQPRISSGATS